jgi:hypothetical protein
MAITDEVDALATRPPDRLSSRQDLIEVRPTQAKLIERLIG